jgi:hypothetical protein
MRPRTFRRPREVRRYVGELLADAAWYDAYGSASGMADPIWNGERITHAEASARLRASAAQTLAELDALLARTAAPALRADDAAPIHVDHEHRALDGDPDPPPRRLARLLTAAPAAPPLSDPRILAG